MRAFGDTVYLVFNGRPDTDSDNDIFLTTNDGSGWTPQLDLTSEFEDSDLRRDYRPVLALTDQGVPVVAYLSTPITADGTAIGSTEIRLLVLGADGPVTVIEATPESMCGALDLAIDTDGAFHVVGGCGGIFTPKLVWATNANGSWTSSPLLLTETLRDFSPTLAAGPGGDVHLSWSGETVCPDRNCRKIFYAKRSASGFGDFTSLSADVEGRAIGPAVAVDANGRPLVAFHSNDGDDADLFLTWADANGNFATPRNITNSPTTNEQGITLTVDPMSGWPIMMFERVFSGTDPLNVDIFRVLPVIDVEPSY